MTYPIKSPAGPSFVSDPGVNENVAMSPEVSSNHQGLSVMDSLRKCTEVLETFSRLREGMNQYQLPPAPGPSRVKSLEFRTVVASSFRQGSLTDSGKLEDSETEILAELDEMDQRIQEDYQRLCQLHSQYCKALDVALQSKTALDSLYTYHHRTYQSQHKDQQKLQLMSDKLQQQSKMLEAKDQEVDELVRKNKDLARKLQDSENQAFNLQSEQNINIHTDVLVRRLENSLREANRRSTSMQEELNTLRQEKAEKVQPDPNVDKDTLSTILKEKTALSKSIENLERSLEVTRQRLKFAENYVVDTRNEIHARDKQIQALEKSLERANHNAMAHESAAIKARAEKYSLSRQLDDLEKRLSLAQNEAGYYRKELINAGVELKDQPRRIEQPEDELRREDTVEMEASPDQAR
ncbi:hypothetical protein [Endozoicomonas sp. 8E]|uniref:hypothetical protein n=1 Tax=Endozoicomonas sp. 8E TaxID=3035692 RepID=UPI00293937E8|nr:hypothetical protein [Endozoicomonas sp. 8E]WOG27618.1 hypothetical protein P6910_24230 [Endozoicomonas sp. 8E]